MCDRLGQLRDALGRYASSFDAGLLTAEQAVQVVAVAATIENMAATVKGLAAVRVAWKDGGHRSAAHHLAHTTGSSVAQAADVLETARLLKELPAVTAAARGGELSPQQVAAVTEAASVDPSTEQRLVEKARSSSLGELREECGRTRAAARPDAEERRRAIRARRFLRSYLDAEGAWNLRVRDNPEVGAQVMAAVDAVRDRIFRAARAGGRRESSEAYGADAWLSWLDPEVVRPEPERWPRSSCGSTWRHCCGDSPLRARCARWPASDRWPCQRSVTSSTPAIPSWLRW